MHPITSGIGIAPHRLAKVLAKPLSAALGVISGAHLPRADPAGRFGGGATGRAPNLTYPQNRISPRISATLFWKSEKKNKN